MNELQTTVGTLQLINALLPLIGAAVGVGVAFVLTRRDAKNAVETAKANNELIAQHAADIARHDARIHELESAVSELHKDLKWIRENMIVDPRRKKDRPKV